MKVTWPMWCIENVDKTHRVQCGFCLNHMMVEGQPPLRDARCHIGVYHDHTTECPLAYRNGAWEEFLMSDVPIYHWRQKYASVHAQEGRETRQGDESEGSRSVEQRSVEESQSCICEHAPQDEADASSEMT